MEIFLVRHGQTNGNVAHRHQSTATPLTPLGRQQIIASAHKLTEFAPTHLITSSVLRAVESAQLIGQILDLIPDTNEVFRELDRPNFLHGNLLKSPRSVLFYSLWYFGLSDNATYGGESYKDLRARVQKAQAVLEQYPEDAKVVVISHSVFINFFLAHMCDPRPMNPFKALIRFIKVFRIKNASITRVTYSKGASKHVCAWQQVK